MLTNATLPSKAFGRGSCSLKWKVSVQDAWTARWEPALRCWAACGRVHKLIGYAASPADQRRYTPAYGYADPRCAYRYPPRDPGWDRSNSYARMDMAGLPVPDKSRCIGCPALRHMSGGVH